MDIAPHELHWRDAYKLMIGSILPRPIAFVSTIDPNGTANLAPFSFFTAICAEPFLIGFAPMRRGTDGRKKDTLVNIEATGEFVVNIVGEQIVEPMNETAAEFEPDVDEFQAAGLTPIYSQLIRPYRVKESGIQMECVLHDILHFGDQPGAGSFVIGKVVLMHISDELYADGKIDMEKLLPIGRMAGHVYTRAVSDTFMLERKK
ncbi:flavin reductase family protein [Paenibacillus thiaminolyticus]|uniref:Flavin reductase family protein n=1 Tax=Paenibacillus thiaminolyticus TaxID=49283 RepID=A0AAP9DQT3_PANTH|nr:flavin reductase family protein [Paenibacillus thiaminolyticus]MCY9536921.1 flavin reductase family protein [Paenibacillus thiaminolyticus]MCY9603671.1 flavin reductase family protein [Paenibacillus thiaminolyticus]MCY9606717.1 flavin reductase family protein [Paenibacillus thiaminolyticus]MCY9612795.1 flavin reductase family protein [Paenibacillus thiaminolyticus]MCY9619715.1 flavin reductase family protein [Paenibacillus thiaminolyticus]